MKKLNNNTISQILRDVFQNRYSLIGSVGAGGMGSVYLVESNDQFRLQRALKIIEKNNQDIYTEVEALKVLDHHGIPKVIEVLETDDYFFIIQEYIKGKSLRQIIEENDEIPEETSILWMSDIADVLLYLHNMGYIHRDIKPTNIMITEDGEVKIIDFGIAKNMNTVDEIDKNVVGTRNYTAPERYDRRPADKRSDIYGFGSTCYYLATGSAPLEVTSNSKKPLRVMIKNLENVESPGIRNIISRCIDINPDKRYQDFNEIRYQLKRIDSFGEIIERNQAKKKRELIGISLLFVLGILSILAGIYVYHVERERNYVRLITNAQEYFDTGNYNESKKAYYEATEYSSRQLAGYQGLFETYTKLGDFQAVVRDAQELMNNNPEAAENANILYLLGNAYYELGEYGQAETYLNQAIALEPTIENHLVLGLNYSAQERYDEAQQVISDLKAMGGDNNTSTYLSGQISSRQGNTTQAISSFNEVINNTTDLNLKQRAIRSLSQLYRNQNNYSSLISTLEEAKKDPVLANDYQVSEMLAEGYYNLAEQGNSAYYQNAINEFNSLIDKGFNQPYIYRNLAIIYQETNNFSGAYEILDRLEEEYPNEAIANIQRAWLELKYQNTLDQDSRDYSAFVEEFNQAQNKDDGSNSSEIQRLTQSYNELKAKGWL